MIDIVSERDESLNLQNKRETVLAYIDTKLEIRLSKQADIICYHFDVKMILKILF